MLMISMAFCKMVRSSFKAKNIPLPLELQYLLSSLIKPNGLFNSVNHPVLLNAYGRAMYKHMALTRIYPLRNYGKFNQTMIAKYPIEKKQGRILNFSWIEKVMDGKQSYSSVLYYDASQQHGPSQQIRYDDSPLGFLRFSRNVHHVHETDEEKDKYLNSIDPHFIGILHDVLTSQSIFIILE
ncbi:uncharacterized protein LOC114271868 [Camellia sinensis]|uniref:uncharacterized protein LOC114271868 n=1 Tax=Camellia sinensis TaxID=4442 RepID=UPI001035E097|nr:uncharacterized protein LOC114271868 [Camellia sinensis]